MAKSTQCRPGGQFDIHAPVPCPSPALLLCPRRLCEACALQESSRGRCNETRTQPEPTQVLVGRPGRRNAKACILVRVRTGRVSITYTRFLDFAD